MRKKMLCFVCLAVLAMSTRAQDDLPERRRSAFHPQREVAFGWGLVEISSPSWWESHDYPNWWRTPLDRYNQGRYTYDERHYTQALSLSYTQEMKRWLAVGLNVSYSGVFQNRRVSESFLIDDTYRKHRFAFYPTVRFIYLNRPVVRLYSGFGLGFGMESEREFGMREYSHRTFVTGQLTFFGVSFGRNLFGSWEIGYGTMGFLKAGAGYRF
ncbi:hypothetical protein [Tannerella sp.]|uniref:hypothetical protein n=1 Tax=Tannerella sp. TaxID=2382127 RepID=UPI003FA33D98